MKLNTPMEPPQGAVREAPASAQASAAPSISFGKRRWPLADALRVAEAVRDWLSPCCERIEIAGSIRRRKATVGDVEILYIPKFADRVVPPDLFPRLHDLVDLELDGLLRAGVIAKRPNVNGQFSWGEKNKLGLHVTSGIPVDFFAATAANWFNYLVCRTGGAENNKKIAMAAQKLGGKWNPYGDGFTDEHFTRFVVKREREVYDHVGLPYREPWERE